jgi:hypothetical protein
MSEGLLNVLLKINRFLWEISLNHPEYSSTCSYLVRLLTREMESIKNKNKPD